MQETGDGTTDGRSDGGNAGETPPAPLAEVPDGRLRDLDVRDQLRRGAEPFERIMAAVSSLDAGEVLRVRAIFEPEPLKGVLGGRGFSHWTERLGPEDFRVWFYRRDTL